jgi:hypothetical protein
MNPLYYFYYLVILGIFLYVLAARLCITKQTSLEDHFEEEGWNYYNLKEILKEEKLPAMVVDLELFLNNVKILGNIAQKYGKKLRLASKSIRVPYLINEILKVALGISYQP